MLQYALRNKKTGQYFRGGSYVTSREPRLYLKRPSVQWTRLRWEEGRGGFYRDPSEWEIVVFETKEIGTEPL